MLSFNFLDIKMASQIYQQGLSVVMFDLKKGLSPQLHRNRPDVPQASRFGTEGQSSCVHGFLFGLPNSTWGAVSSG